MWLQLFVFVFSAVFIIVQTSLANNHFHFEQRNEVYKLRPFTKRYNTAFYHRHNNAYRFSSAVHFTVISGGLGFGVGDEFPDVRAVLGFQYTY